MKPNFRPCEIISGAAAAPLTVDRLHPTGGDLSALTLQVSVDRLQKKDPHISVKASDANSSQRYFRISRGPYLDRSEVRALQFGKTI